MRVIPSPSPDSPDSKTDCDILEHTFEGRLTQSAGPATVLISLVWRKCSYGPPAQGLGHDSAPKAKKRIQKICIHIMYILYTVYRGHSRWSVWQFVVQWPKQSKIDHVEWRNPEPMLWVSKSLTRIELWSPCGPWLSYPRIKTVECDGDFLFCLCSRILRGWSTFNIPFGMVHLCSTKWCIEPKAMLNNEDDFYFGVKCGNDLKW